MQKLILIAIFMFTYNNNVICMKRPRTAETIDTKKKQCLLTTSDSFLPTEIQHNIHKDVVESFKCGNHTPQEVALAVKNMRVVNRSWRNFFDNPDTIRTVISNASFAPYYRGFLAHSKCLATLPSVNNYVEQSEKLIRQIRTIDENTVKAFISAGADINYCYECDGSTLVFPILWNTRDDYNKTKLLLDLGADQNIKRNALTPLAFAIFYEKIEFIRLFLGYKPQKKHVKVAVQSNHLETLQLVLQQKDIPVKEIEKGKKEAKTQGNHLFLQLLNEYKNDKELCK